MKTLSHNTDIKKLDRLAWLLDSSIKIPGTQRTIGVDGIIGLIPGIGDLSSGLISAYIVLQALQMDVSKSVISKMIVNILLDTTIGAIPLFGDIFDIIYKSNQRNVSLISNHLEKSKKHS